MSEISTFAACKCVLCKAEHLKGFCPQMRTLIGHFMSFPLQSDTTVLISVVDRGNASVITDSENNDMSGSQRKILNTKGPCLPACLLYSHDYHLEGSHTVLTTVSQKWDLFHAWMVHERNTVEFWFCSCALLMLDWQAAQRLQPNHKNIGWEYLFGLLRFSGHSSAFTTGAS